MKTVLKTALFELENLFNKKIVWLLITAYALCTFVVCASDDFRYSYFSVMESVPVALNNFVLSVVLMAILTGVLAPVFAGDKEQGIEQIAGPCLIGSKGRSTAKIFGAVLFALIVIILLETITLTLCFSFSLADITIPVGYVGTEVELLPIWTAGQHIVFSVITLTIGCIILTLLVLLVSCMVKSVLSAVSLSCIFILIEFIIHKFSFPTFLQEYNIWVFFRPYYLFITEIFNISPYINLLILSVMFLPLSVLMIWHIVRKGV